MSIIFYWGDDDFAIDRAVIALQKSSIDPAWASFNYEKFTHDREETVIQTLNQAMTPPFGMGKRLVWLADTTLAQQCSDNILGELERTLPRIPDTTILLLTNKSKPDARLKSTKTLQKYANIQEFSLIPPWKTDELQTHVKQAAQELQLKLTPEAIDLLTEAVGNNTRQLYLELEKLQLLAGDKSTAIDAKMVSSLVVANTQNSLQLAAAIREGNVGKSLTLVTELIERNEPALKIVATLVGQFRTWLWVKMLLEAGEKDEKVIATAAGLGNPKRLYFIKQELHQINATKIAAALPKLLSLELSLKRGGEPVATLQVHTIELCQIFSNASCS
jgi:DNA polymerase III subunit delta